MGAAKSNLRGGFRQGGSTITMQVARNFFLSREKLIGRKLNEVALAYKIERALSKDEILELYMNQIYLGQRAYGFGSASKIYFGKSLGDLSVAEMAMLAGLPQNPARHNPVVNPKGARARQHVVLKSMRDLELHQRGRVPAGAGRNAARQSEGPGIRHPRRIRRRTGAPGGVRAVQGRGLHQGYRGHHHHPQGRPGRRLPVAAPQRAGLRPAPRLSRPGSADRPARRSGRARRRDRRGAAEAPLERRPAAGGGAGGIAENGAGRDGRRRNHRHHRRRPEVRRRRTGCQGEGRGQAGARRHRARQPGGQEELEHRAAAAGIGRLRVDRRRHRRLPRAGRRLRFQPAEVQPRDAGVAPAGIRAQALPVFVVAGKRLFAGHR